jgi:hypothetical protein
LKTKMWTVNVSDAAPIWKWPETHLLKSSPSCLSMERPIDIAITRLCMSKSTWILCCKKTILPDPLNPPATGGQFHRLQRVSWEIVV